MLDNFSNTAQSYKPAGQAPLDAKYLIEDIEELYTTEPNETRAYSFYAGYMCYVAPLNEWYVWTDNWGDNVTDTDMILDSEFTYPEGTEYGGIDYSERKFVFVKVNMLLGSSSELEVINIESMMAAYVNLCSDKGTDVLNPTDENIHNALNTLLDYIKFYFKRNNLLHFVDNLFAFTSNVTVRKELDDKYRSNSMYYVLGNHVIANDFENPTQITFQSQRIQGSDSQIGLASHNGFMALIARSIYNIIKANGTGYVDLQSHDGAFMSLKFTGQSALFARGNPYDTLGPEGFDMATFIQINGTLDSKYGTLVNKPVKVSIRSVFGKDNQLNVPETDIPIKKAIIGFRRQDVLDNSFVMTHGLNVERYITEHFSYPPSIYEGMVPVTLSPRELQEARIISNYGPNDADTIYLQDIVAYKSEEASEMIYYIVEYIERRDYELTMPYDLTKIIQLNNDPSEEYEDYFITMEELGAGFYSPFDGTFGITKLHITEVSDMDMVNYPDEKLMFDGEEIDPPLEMDYADVTENFVVSVKASGGNRPVRSFIYQVEDSQGRLSNPVNFQIIKQGFDPNNNTPPIINPTPIINGYGDILAQWSQIVRLTSLGQYYIQAIPYDADSDYGGNIEAPGELEVRFEIIKLSNGAVILDSTHTGVRSEQMVMEGFYFPEDGNISPNTVHEFMFRFTVTDPQGASTTVERKLITIY